MTNTKTLQNPKSLDFSDTPFHKLMQRRVYRVLLICSRFDAFILEEDGRIDEQIFNEYASLNLRYPPSFIQAHSSDEAIAAMQEHSIDLIIIMLNPGDMDALGLAKDIKIAQPGIPVIILSHVSKDVAELLEADDLNSIDHIFCWLGNANILLAIIKLVEDRMNAYHDVLSVGVQSIILVESSVRAYSSILPDLYKMVMQQSHGFMVEGLNEHQQTLRMRGRPKILLAKTYQEALKLYERFNPNIIGVIADASVPLNADTNTRNNQNGLEFCKLVLDEDPHLPFLLQSQNGELEPLAKKLNAGFLLKNSKSYILELRNYVSKHFGFGDFVFINPDTQQPIANASNLQELQQQILSVPDNSLEYHSKFNHISRWLNARALFPIARLFRPIALTDFSSLQEARNYINQAISAYRISKGRGVIAQFHAKTFDHHIRFSRIGSGSIGGKARGLAFIRAALRNHFAPDRYPNISIDIPRSVVVSTNFYDRFIDSNNLFKIGVSNISDKEILRHFTNAPLPHELVDDLEALVKGFSKPLAVRSSSILEDSRHQPFAGIYATYLVPYSSNHSDMLSNLQVAIKSVYASVFFKASKAYMAATSNIIDQEKLGVLIQEVCGENYRELFFPTLSGVARSVNYYPVGAEQANEGVATVALGLGRHITNGEVAIRLSPQNPKRILQLSQPDMAVRQTQKVFYALSNSTDHFKPDTNDGVNILRLPVEEAQGINAFPQIASTLDSSNQTIRDGVHDDGLKLVTFAGMLKHKSFPLAQIIADLLDLGQREMGCNVEIEFAANIHANQAEPSQLRLLQIRPMVESEQTVDFNWDALDTQDAIVYSPIALGHGSIRNISDIVYVDPGTFNPADTQKIAAEIEQVNSMYMQAKRNYMLIGPGRWGSSDRWLGIPIRWAQISEARVIVEYTTDDFKVEPSFGTHFFQSLTSFRVGYLTVNPSLRQGALNHDYLKSLESWHETDYLKCFRFTNPLQVAIDGRDKQGVVLKPTT